MKAITIYRADSLDKAVHRQEAMPNGIMLSEQQLNAWRELEGFLGFKREYFNGDDGNIWLIANSLFLYKVSPDGFPVTIDQQQIIFSSIRSVLVVVVEHLGVEYQLFAVFVLTQNADDANLLAERLSQSIAGMNVGETIW